jgi:uroporphyrinogen decarboxylase
MERRERIRRVLNHQEPDRVLVDVGTTLVTGIHKLAYIELTKYLNLSVGEPVVTDIMQQLVVPEEKLLKYLDVDFRGVFPGLPDNNNTVFLEDGTWIDEWGVERKKPDTGFYFDVVKSPLDMDKITLKDLDNYNWPNPNDPGRFRGLKEQAKKLKENTDYGIIINLEAVFIHISQYMRGFKHWYEDLIINKEILCEILDRILDFYLQLGEHLLREAGEYADVVFVGDDITGQHGALFSPKLYKEIFKPRQAKLFDFIHKHSKGKLMYHCCGDVSWVIDDLIEIGMDILNPVQVSASNMDTRLLKEKYGDKISFWGGVDTQRVMPFGTVDDVKKEVERRIRDLGPGGGYICGQVHDIQPLTPPENIMALYDHAKEFGRYPLK